MNGIDIAGHQKGINLAVVPCDFVIVKATQGKTFVNPEFTTQITQALSLGKYAGVYHYANGAGVDIEANHFIDVVRPYLGKVILCLDWENNKDKYGNNDNPKFAAGDYKYCEQLLVAIQKKIGITPFLYMSKSVARQYKWEVGRNFPFWCAQYANYQYTGYKVNPWTDDKGFGPWKNCAIFQYSSRGRLPGYNDNLDLDKAYISAEQWRVLFFPHAIEDKTDDCIIIHDHSALPFWLKHGLNDGECSAGHPFFVQRTFPLWICCDKCGLSPVLTSYFLQMNHC